MRITKAAGVRPAGTPSPAQLEKINRQAKAALTAEQVYLFSIRLCDDRPDRDGERFDTAALPVLAELFIGNERASLLLGKEDGGGRLYPLCGVMQRLGYEYAAAAGSWQLTRPADESEIAIMTKGETGLCDGAMGSVDGVIFLTGGESRVWAYGGELYVTQAVLETLGVSVLDVNGTPVLR